MADNDFLGGLFGGVRDAGSALFGLLGGPSGTPAAGGPTDPYDMLSEGEKRRLTYGALGQLGATLLAAGQKQMPAQRAQQLAQLGNIGPNLDMQMQRAVAVRNQQEQLRRQNELFPLQRQQMAGAIEAQQQQLAMQRQQAAMGVANLQRQIQTMESMGLDASSIREQLRIAQQYMTGGAGVPGGAPAGSVGAPAPTGSAPAVSAGASMAPGATVPSPAPAPSMAPYAPSEAVSEAGYGGEAGQQASMGFQRVLSQLPYLSPSVVRSALGQGGDLTKTMADLYKENEKAKQEAFKAEADIQKEYRPRAETFANLQSNFKSMINLAQEATGPSDIMLITQLYKVFDEGSVVSITETGQIKSTTPLPERLQSLVDQFKSGEVLIPEARQRILDAAKTKFTESYRKYNLDFEQQSKNAIRRGLDATAAVPDVRDPQLRPVAERLLSLPASRQVDVGNGRETAKLGVDGQYYVVRDGKRVPIEREE